MTDMQLLEMTARGRTGFDTGKQNPSPSDLAALETLIARLKVLEAHGFLKLAKPTRPATAQHHALSIEVQYLRRGGVEALRKAGFTGKIVAPQSEH